MPKNPKSRNAEPVISTEMTIAEYAKSQDIPYVMAASFLKLMAKLGKIQSGKKDPIAGQRGRATLLYSIPSSVIELNLANLKG